MRTLTTISLAPLPPRRSRRPSGAPDGQAPLAALEAGPGTEVATGFATGTQIRTFFGWQRVERLMAGDLLLDAEGHLHELRAIRRHRAKPGQMIRLSPSAEGIGRIVDTVTLGAGQMLETDDWRVMLLSARKGFVPAGRLCDGRGILRNTAGGLLHDLICDAPCVIDIGGGAKARLERTEPA
ncbi:MAG: Hint domain-containing protein [Roseinatronobacter sp.]